MTSKVRRGTGPRHSTHARYSARAQRDWQGKKRSGVIPWMGVWRQSRADAPPLLVGLAVIAAATFLSVAVPQAMDVVATSEVRASVSSQDAKTAIIVTVPMSDSDGASYELAPDTVNGAGYVRDRLEAGMPQELRSVLSSPVTSLVGAELKAGSIADRPGRIRFIYVASQGGPAVKWIEGRPPAATSSPKDLLYTDSEDISIEVAVSKSAAALMGIHAGDPLPVQREDGRDLQVHVTGIYEVSDPTDVAWSIAPTLVDPVLVGGSESFASVGLYTTADSVPYARLALYPAEMSRTFTYAVEPGAFDSSGARQVATEARGLASGKKVFEVVGAAPVVTTQLDRVLDDAFARIDAAKAQASVVLIGLLAVAVLVELLAASLVAERRAVVVAQWRSRGATLPAIGLATACESALVAAMGGAAGLVAARYAVGGGYPWAWLLPPLVVAVAAQPWLVLRVASGRNSKRRGGARVRQGLTAVQVRRLGAELLLAVVAIGSLMTLRSRGVAASAGNVWADVAVLAAPVFVALAVVMILMRLQPRVLGVLRATAAKSRGVVLLLTAARTKAHATATAALLTAGVIAGIAATVAGTVAQGQADASWDAVGADAVASTSAAAGLPASVQELDGSYGLAAATGTVFLGGQAVGAKINKSVDVIAIDAAAMERVLAATPARDAPALGTLAAASASASTAGEAGSAVAASPVPILVMGSDEAWEGATLRWDNETVEVTRVGDPPVLPVELTGNRLIVVVDRQALGRAAGFDIAPTLAWVSGPSAAQHLDTALGTVNATTASRDGWVAQRRDAPVARALQWFFAASAVVATVLGALAVALIAASGSWERTRVIAQIRVVGTPRKAATRVAWLEATLPAVVATGIGLAVGIGLARVLVTALGLASLTGGTGSPAVVTPWWCLAIPLLLGVVARTAVAVATLREGHQRLGALMRLG